jgi:hypothetical protein
VRFRHESVAGRWHLRLVVLTGNSTRETLEQGLDLVWRLDLFDHKLNGCDDVVTQCHADFKAASLLSNHSLTEERQAVLSRWHDQELHANCIRGESAPVSCMSWLLGGRDSVKPTLLM